MKPSIDSWLASASQRLSRSGIDSARLDSELILCKALGVERTYLHCHGDKLLSQLDKKKANIMLKKRLRLVPLAYIYGFKEFYGRNFFVTKHTLIPRPESEMIIELFKRHAMSPKSLVDVGAGCGCLGITAKLEDPDLEVTLIDNSQRALVVAKNNASRLDVDVHIKKCNLLSGLVGCVDIILANLPYVDKSWQLSPTLDHEPSSALYANDGGLEIIKQLIPQASKKLKEKGLLIIESDPRQFETIISLAANFDFKLIEQSGYCLAFRLI